MRPILFELFGHAIHSFGAMVALAFMAALAWTIAEARRAGRDPALFVDAFWRVAFAGLFGARLVYVVVHPEELSGDSGWLGLFAIWRGGLVWYGGLVLAVATGLWFVARRGAARLPALDLAMPGTWLGLAIGRMGCWLVADDFGRPTDGAWGVKFPPLPGSMLEPRYFGVALHPTQLYDSLNALVVFLVSAVVLRRSRCAGRVAGVALAHYSAGRFVVEHFRGDDPARGLFTWPGSTLTLSTSQWISLPLFLVGLALATFVSARARPAASGGAG